MRTPLQKEEKILLITHRSWITLIGPSLIFIAACVAAYFLGSKYYGWVAALAGFIYLIIKYFEWRANLWGVTNYRVIDEGGLFSHFAKESPLDKINNVSYKQTIFGRIFNYGNV